MVKELDSTTFTVPPLLLAAIAWRCRVEDPLGSAGDPPSAPSLLRGLENKSYEERQKQRETK